eukprot:scaffold382925_cov27-Prasinocladus_malaysianus.AAC.1
MTTPSTSADGQAFYFLGPDNQPAGPVALTALRRKCQTLKYPSNPKVPFPSCLTLSRTWLWDFPRAS